ncbi:MAG: hypothetical protein RLN76_01315 [Phycisphaeraceae bacterium]
MTIQWTTRALGETGVEVGWCAWSSEALRQDPELITRCPSLVVFDERRGETPESAAELDGVVGHSPVLVIVEEPSFARYLSAGLDRWREALGRQRLDLVALSVDEIRDLKGGGLLQPLVDGRAAGKIGAIGFVGDTANDTEWLAMNTAGRFLITRFTLKDQSAWYRAIPTATEYGMTVIGEVADDVGEDGGLGGAAFALGRSPQVLPMRATPLPSGVEPMDEAGLARAWAGYSATHAEPEKLPRGRPPAGGEG